MTRKEIAKRLLAMHGAISLVFLLLISWSIWTGILSVYADLARPWLRADVAAAFDNPAASPSAVLDFILQGGSLGESWNLLAPTPLRPFHVYAGPVPPGGAPQVLMVNPATGLREPWNNLAADGLFRRIHTDLLLPKPWGRLAMGLAGALITILVGTGLFIHGKQIRDAWRWRRSSPLLDLSESHKRVGLWLTPFLLLMALTGAILGLKIAIPPVAQALGVAVEVPERPTFTRSLELTRLDRCVSDALAAAPDTRFAAINRSGDRVEIRLLRLRSLQWWGEGGGSVRALCDLTAGSVRLIQTAPSGGIWGALESALRPIHYARFDSTAVLVAYILLSLLCLWSIDSGMKLLWLRQAGDGADSVSRRLYRANNQLYGVLPLLLLAGNLVAGCTPWLLMACAILILVALNLTRWAGWLRHPALSWGLAAAYMLLIAGRHWLLPWTGAAWPPVLLTDASLLGMAFWLLQPWRPSPAAADRDPGRPTGTKETKGAQHQTG
ncbi:MULTISPECIES: PepSY domain-containing protein [unclassified Azospirillum]|uniref:PepSY-associated TM helix domain-containing protein n=1 Tax=unclassified Azospirillum TaxID=2630922 RepID=UPI000B631634|nr:MULTISPECIES: PepSY-associated TM helix domain-containing protein [unclassified Azospirillum]SNT11233.1 Uncharacterized iron-regulated membrane protein [Azospirillum sp. RU38E]SNT24254.1 Uncharacterized iron-regulated membrane protein [Azospirillum sp. RU37A]